MNLILSYTEKYILKPVFFLNDIILFFLLFIFMIMSCNAQLLVTQIGSYMHFKIVYLCYFLKIFYLCYILLKTWLYLLVQRHSSYQWGVPNDLKGHRQCGRVSSHEGVAYERDGYTGELFIQLKSLL